MIRRAAPLALGLALVALAGCGKKQRRAAPPPVAADAGVAAVIVDAAAAPVAPPDARAPSVVEPTTVPACDRYQAVLIAALACPTLADNREALQANLDTLQRNFAAWPALPAAQRKVTLKAAATQCQGGVDGVTRAMTSAACPP